MQNDSKLKAIAKAIQLLSDAQLNLINEEYGDDSWAVEQKIVNAIIALKNEEWDFDAMLEFVDMH